MSDEAVLNVNEIFGPVFQGEGPSTGRVCYFVRTSVCNLMCSFCDTPYTWAYTDAKAAKHREGKKYDKSEEQASLTIQDVIDKLVELGWSDELVVISGGEPLLQKDSVYKLVEELSKHSGYMASFEIETAGTLSPTVFSEWLDISFNVSPKLESSGNLLKARRNIDALKEFNELGACFKFVASRNSLEADLEEIKKLQSLAEIPDSSIWLMPEGISSQEVMANARVLAPIATEHHYNLTLRQHVLLFEDERGV